MVKRIVLFQGIKSQVGLMSTQLVTNSPDGTTGLGPKGNQVEGKESSEPLLHPGLGTHGASRCV